MSRIIKDVLIDARRRLAAAPFKPPTREANLLLAQALGSTEVQLLARQEETLTEPVLRQFESAMNRRLAGEPVAYIVGGKEFYGRDFRVDPRVLIPRPESEHLIEVALELPLPHHPTILDIGTGSGCLACTLALELPAARVLGADVSIKALALANRNVTRHGLTGRLRLLATDLVQALDLSAVDLVLSNPPYIGSEEAHTLSGEILDFEPEIALFAGPDGGLFHRRLLSEMTGLRSGSWLVLEIGAGQEETIRRLAIESLFHLVELRHDYASHPRVAVLRRR